MQDSSETDTATDEDTGLGPASGANRPAETYKATDSPCRREECDGRLWYDDHTLVCGTCYTMVDMDRQRRSASMSSPWESFRGDHRATYRNSDTTRMAGGYPHAYDWATSDETDGTIGALDPTEFYR